MKCFWERGPLCWKCFKTQPAAGSVFWKNIPRCRKCFQGKQTSLSSVVPVRGLLCRMCPLEKGTSSGRSFTRERGPDSSQCFLGKWTPLLEVSSGKVDLFIGNRGPLSWMCSLGKGSLCWKRRQGRGPPLSEMSSGKGDPFAGSFFQEQGPFLEVLSRKENPFAGSVFQEKGPRCQKCFLGKGTSQMEVSSSRPLCHKCSPGKETSVLDEYSGKRYPFGRK